MVLRRGGRLQHFYNYWASVTTHSWPLSVIKEGYRLQFVSPPQPWYSNVYNNPSPDVSTAVSLFLDAGVIERSLDQDGRFLSHFFTIQEATKSRPVLDCKKISSFVQCSHFKMEGVPALRELIQPNDFMAKIDLKDAYTVVPIHPASRRYLAFAHAGTIYQYKTLPFGLSVAPRIFMKIMRHAIEVLRKEGIRIVYYLDDICVLARTPQEMEHHTSRIVNHLQHLGVFINFKKTQLTPTHAQDFLGFSFNTNKMMIKVPNIKMEKLLARIKQARKPQSYRWMAALLGKITSMIPAIGKALLNIRSIQRDLTKSLRLSSNNWERRCTVQYLDGSSLVGIGLVDSHGTQQKWSTDTTPTATSTNCRLVRGCIRYGVGHCVPSPSNIRILDKGRKRTINQHTGTTNDPFCYTITQKCLCGPEHKVILRQHHSLKTRAKARGDSVAVAPGPGFGDLCTTQYLTRFKSTFSISQVSSTPQQMR
ncbi:hypothetical protein [Absidia glauca]|uniref:Reverse transcriptase domain-containing protein n=1 Tax=Absidia glauca TaxID=4829 RepID=A0A168LJ58_ABSGL|nr:hypothetical protein [Absidia glauca]